MRVRPALDLTGPQMQPEQPGRITRSWPGQQKTPGQSAPGGCSGLRYELFFDDRTLDGDALVYFGGIGLAVDRMSKPYLDGAVIDFVDTIEKQGFTIDNPNAQNSCACGDSFH